jgi:translation initiation factor 2B subunit (eIF-2B alpha/beta/delta family)
MHEFSACAQRALAPQAHRRSPENAVRRAGRSVAAASVMGNDNLKDKIDQAADKAKDIAEKAGEKIEDGADKVAEKSRDAADKLEDKGRDLGKKIGG